MKVPTVLIGIRLSQPASHHLKSPAHQMSISHALAVLGNLLAGRTSTRLPKSSPSGVVACFVVTDIPEMMLIPVARHETCCHPACASLGCPCQQWPINTCAQRTSSDSNPNPSASDEQSSHLQLAASTNPPYRAALWMGITSALRCCGNRGW